jgi:hypothetical protein
VSRQLGVCMFEPSASLPEHVLAHLTEDELYYLTEVFKRFGGYPSIEEIWRLMDEPWFALGCNPMQFDERIRAFYLHPVWVLNGLFIEQDTDSLAHRRVFTDWVVKQAPARVADFGGGFGGLARLIGKALPKAEVDVVEPHPRPVAVAMAADTPNVRFLPSLSGEYDLLIATDVFEHVPDPLGLCADTAAHLKVGGQYLIANCFAPIIQCHLPQHFYLEFGWDAALNALGMEPCERVRYGRAYRRTGMLDLVAARKTGELARRMYRFLRYLPRGRTRLGSIAMKLFSPVI